MNTLGPIQLSFISVMVSALFLTACGSGKDNAKDTSKQNEINNNSNIKNSSGTTQPSGIDIPSKVIYNSNGASVASTSNTDIKAYSKVIDNQADYTAQFSKSAKEVSNLPVVDFTKQRVVMMTLGLQGNNGNSLSLVRSYDDGNGVKAIINQNILASNCPASTVMTMPNIFVRIDTTKPIAIVPKQIIKTCTDASAQVDFQVLKQDDGATAFDKLGNIQAYDKVLTTKEDYKTEFSKFSTDNPAMINFDTQKVVVASSGTKTTGGNSITVEQVYNEGNKTKVVLIEENLGSNCFGTTVMTVPYVFVAVDTTKEIEIQRIKRSKSC